MPTSQKSVNAAFSKLEISLVKGKAQGLVGSYGFTQADLPDIEQELFLEVFLKRHTLRKWKKQKASERTVLSRILDNRIRKIIEAASTDKRRVTMFSESLDAPVGHNENGDPITLLDLLVETGPSYTPTTLDLQIELSLNANALSSQQLHINILITQGLSITEIADRLGMKRTTLHHELAKIRALMSRHGFGECA